MTDSASLDFMVPLNVDFEDLNIEFKRTLPLNEKEGKAKLAKEICALSNHGGGWIVLGREDDGSYPNTLPEDLHGVDQDTINQIVSTYLQPPPHCYVRWMKPKDVPFDVLVIWASSHGVSPISGAKNGPNGATGGTVGVVKGSHYIRKAGPVSERIESPDEWQTLIRRCVLNDKTSLLAALTTMLDKPDQTADDKIRQILEIDFEHIINVWKAETSKYPSDIDLSENFICYGFHFLDAPPVSTNTIIDCLRNSPMDAQGRHQFFDIQYNRPVLIEVENTAGLEFRATSNDFEPRSAWRVNESLSGVEVISYWEDSTWIKSVVEERSSRTWERGKAFWIKQQIAYCDSFLAKVKHIADFLSYDGVIRLRILFHGLKGRSLDSPNAAVHYSMKYEVHQNAKMIDLIIKANALEPESRSSTVAAIIQPVNKLTQGPEVTAKTVVKYLASNR